MTYSSRRTWTGIKVVEGVVYIQVFDLSWLSCAYQFVFLFSRCLVPYCLYLVFIRFYMYFILCFCLLRLFSLRIYQDLSQVEGLFGCTLLYGYELSLGYDDDDLNLTWDTCLIKESEFEKKDLRGNRGRHPYYFYRTFSRYY